MTHSDDLRRENAALRERIAALNAASLLISAGLDLDPVLAEVTQSTRGLAGARYGVIAIVYEAGAPGYAREALQAEISSVMNRDWLRIGHGPSRASICSAAECWSLPGLDGSSGEMPACSLASRHSCGCAGLPASGRRGRGWVEVDGTVVVLNGLFVPA